MEAAAVKTAVSLGASLLGSALKLAGSAAVQEVAWILNLGTEIENIKSELRMMQAFLKKAAEKAIQDPFIENMVKEVKDLSYEAEDCIAEFAIHVNAKQMLLMNLGARRKIAKSIVRLKEKLEMCTKSFERFSGIIPYQLNEDGINVDSRYAPRLVEPLYIRDFDLVGLDKSKQELIELILSYQETNVHAKEAVVSGMGGIGKTTLVKKVYDSCDLRSKFDCFSWITISTSFNTKSLIEDMAKQLFGSEKEKNFENMNAREISDYLHKYLKDRKCLVILDDLWKVADWYKIKPFLPPERTVVVTSRDEKVIAGADIYHVEKLNNSDSYNLLMKKVSRKHDLEEIPAELIEIAHKFLKLCKGLPLALATIGGLLASFPLNKENWNILHEYFTTELENNPEFESIKTVLTLSYLHLPEHLKSCFLYLTIFPEDYEIKRSDVVKHWIAQDCVHREEDGENNFNDLLSRNMIIPSKFDIVFGGVKTCRIHDIMRDVMISIASKENFLLTLTENRRIFSFEKVRHVSLSGNASIEDFRSANMNCIRSISTFGDARLGDWNSSCSFTMLKVLDAGKRLGFHADDIISVKGIKGIKELKHLKYINVRNHDKLSRMTEEICNIKGLQILDVSGSEIEKLPSRFAELLDMRHIAIGYSNSGAIIDRGILQNLKELRTLKYLRLKHDCGNEVLKEISELCQLRVLGIDNIDEKDNGKLLCSAVKKLQKLVKLSLIGSYPFSDWTNILDCIAWPPLLRSLTLGSLSSESLSWVASLKNIRKLSLKQTNLKKDVIVMLGELPELLILKIYGEPFENCKELAFGSGSFAKLVQLEMTDLFSSRDERSVVIHEGALGACKSITFYGYSIFSITGVHNLKSLDDLTIREYLSCPVKLEREELSRIIQELPKGARFTYGPGHPQDRTS